MVTWVCYGRRTKVPTFFGKTFECSSYETQLVHSSLYLAWNLLQWRSLPLSPNILVSKTQLAVAQLKGSASTRIVGYFYFFAEGLGFCEDDEAAVESMSKCSSVRFQYCVHEHPCDDTHWLCSAAVGLARKGTSEGFRRFSIRQSWNKTVNLARFALTSKDHGNEKSHGLANFTGARENDILILGQMEPL